MDTEICESLIKWFKTLNLTSPHDNAEQLSDGVALAQALNQFARDSFSDNWLAKMKTDAGSNWRLKMSNLKKVIEGLYDYYADVLNYSLNGFTRPDAQRIAEKSDKRELERLLQLVLGCAVNCADKQDYIRQIMLLEESLQQNIMRALQELESTWQGVSLSRSSLSIASFDTKLLQEERDALAQKCFETERRLSLLVEEKANLQQELLKMQKEIERLENAGGTTIGDDGVSLGPVQAGSARYNELRRQLDLLKDELLHSETSREDLKLRTIQQEKELQHMQQRIDELTKSTAVLTQLKDEVDVLRESYDKLKVCEAQLETYKKKLEEYNDLKKNIKVLEERNAGYVQQSLQFEEDAKKYATIKGQIELFKKEIQELHTKLDNEASKNVKLEFDNKNLENNFNALQRAKESLLKERDTLREVIDELKCGQLTTSTSFNGNTMSKELQPTAIIDKIQRLELENKGLREGQGGQTALAQLLDDANKRNENLREQLKVANERILSLTSQSDDPVLKENEFGKQIKQLMELNEQKTLQLDESAVQNAALQSKLSQLENTLSGREQDLVASETRYRKCIEKAKEVIKSLDSRAANVIDVNVLEKQFSNDSEESEQNKAKMSVFEEQLMTTAFYRLGINAQRDAIDSKLLMMGPGQTFLARQRQSAPRKSATTFKSK